MKHYFYRSLAHLKHNPDVPCSQQTPPQMNQLLDQKLHYINRSFKHNLQIQQIFLDITKTKRTLHSKQIKQYYKLFTQNKADSEIFHNTLQDTQKQNVEQFLHIQDASRSLKRLYCRLIEKMMIKLSFYMMNKQRLNFMYKEVKEMMKKCETLMRRLNYLRDTHSINQLIQEIYRENEDMQIKIIQELIDKGFIISIDQFYRINGVDLVDKELYERIKSDLGQEDSEEGMKDEEIDQKLQSMKKFEFNLNKKSSFQRMVKEEGVKKKKQAKKIVHRSGYIQIQNKYRDLLVHLQNLINNDLIDEIAEEKEEVHSSDSESKEPEQQSLFSSQIGSIKQESVHSSAKEHKISQTSSHFKVEEQPIPSKQPEPEPKLEQDLQLKEEKPPHQIRQYTKKSSSESNGKEVSYYECKSEVRPKEITLSNVESNSHISDNINNRGARPNSRKKSSDFFSKSFMSAIKTMQKINLNDKTNRLAIKRMSEHIISFHKQSEHSSNAETYRTANAVNISNVLRRNNEKKSIIKLINIYKSRKFQEEIHSMQKQFDDYKEKIIKKEETLISPRPKNNKLSIFYEDSKRQLNEISEEKTITNITNYPKIADTRESHNDLSSYKHKKYQKNSVFKLIPKDLKIQESVSEEFMKSIETIKAKIRLTTNTRTPYFSNARLSHRIQSYEQTLQSPNISPGRMVNPNIQANSLLTSKGIQTIDYQQFKTLLCDRKDKIKMCKTAFVSPSNQLNSQVGRFEVYDRNRRVILR